MTAKLRLASFDLQEVVDGFRVRRRLLSAGPRAGEYEQGEQKHRQEPCGDEGGTRGPIDHPRSMPICEPARMKGTSGMARPPSALERRCCAQIVYSGLFGSLGSCPFVRRTSSSGF